MRGIGVLTRTLGDVIMVNTLARNIQLKYGENIELDWIVEKSYVDIVKNNPDIKNVIVIESMGKEWDFVLDVISHNYDEVFFFQQITPEDGFWHQNDKYRFKNLIDFYAKRGCIELIDKKLRWYNFSDTIEVGQGKIVVVHTTTLGDAKNWDKFGDLLVRLLSEGFTVYQVGAVSDVLIGISETYDLRGKLSLPEIATLLRDKCSCFVGLDSGLSFMAAAVDVPTVVIMGASVTVTSGPWGTNVRHMLSDTRDECKDRRCHALYNKCKFNDKCINRIRIEDVISKIKEVAIEKS